VDVASNYTSGRINGKPSQVVPAKPAVVGHISENAEPDGSNFAMKQSCAPASDVCAAPGVARPVARRATPIYALRPNRRQLPALIKARPTQKSKIGQRGARGINFRDKDVAVTVLSFGLRPPGRSGRRGIAVAGYIGIPDGTTAIAWPASVLEPPIRVE